MRDLLFFGIIALVTISLIFIFSDREIRNKLKPLWVVLTALVASVTLLWFTGLIPKAIQENSLKEAGGIEKVQENLVYLMNLRYKGYNEENRAEVGERVRSIVAPDEASEILNDFEKVHTNIFIDLEEEFLLRMNPSDVPGEEDINILSDAGTEGAENEDPNQSGISANRYDYTMVDWRIQSKNNRRGVWLKNVDIDPILGEDSVLINGEVYPLRLNPQYALPNIVGDPRYYFEIVDFFLTKEGNFVANFRSKNFLETHKESYNKIIAELEEKTKQTFTEEEKERMKESLVGTGFFPPETPRANLSMPNLYEKLPQEQLEGEFEYLQITDDGLTVVDKSLIPKPEDNIEGELFEKPVKEYDYDELQPYHITLTGSITKDGKIKPKELEKIVGIFVERNPEFQQ